jgi:hypothetical protein
VTPPRQSPSGTPLRTHYAAHSPEAGWAIPECRKRRPDPDMQPATLDPAEVTCAVCRRILATGDRRAS